VVQLVAAAAAAPDITDVTGGAVSCTQESSLDVSFTDADSEDTHEAVVDWGDGTSSTYEDVSSPFTATHSYGEAGTWTATVTVTDGAGGSDSETEDLTVDYTVVGGGYQPPLSSTTTTSHKYGSTTPVRVVLADCDNSRPRNLMPTLEVSQGDYSTDGGLLRFTGSGQYVVMFKTSALPGPGTYTYTVTVPETGQQITGQVRLT
jgi:PKD repeat protein